MLVGAGTAVWAVQGRAAEAAARAAELDAARTADLRSAALLGAEQAADRGRQRAQVEGAAALAVTATWQTSAQAATAELAAAADLLAETDGEADAAARDAVAVAVAATEAALAAAEPRTSAQISALAAARDTLAATTEALTAAHAAWQAEQEAQARAATRASGAGADCGGVSIREQPTGGGSGMYTSVPTEDGDGSNGNLPRSAMTALSWCVDTQGNAQWLRSDAAAAMTELNAAFRAEFGENIAIDLSYRSYADQVLAKQLFGGLAATPGTSNHGWGTAIDTWEWDAYDFGSARHEWLVANGPAFGWVCPAATESGNPEYWHFEFTG